MCVFFNKENSQASFKPNIHLLCDIKVKNYNPLPTASKTN